MRCAGGRQARRARPRRAPARTCREGSAPRVVADQALDVDELAGPFEPSPLTDAACVEGSEFGLQRAPAWALPAAALGEMLGLIGAPLGLGRVTLADGSEVTGFICESGALDDAVDITEPGGWRAYLPAQGAPA